MMRPAVMKAIFLATMLCALISLPARAEVRILASPGGQVVWFEYKGSVQGTRPGLLRTDTLKKAIANGALDACKAMGYAASVVAVDRGGATLVGGVG